MDKITHISADGSIVDYFPQSYTDDAVKAALAAATPAVDPEATEVDVILTDGTSKKFVPAA